MDCSGNNGINPHLVVEHYKTQLREKRRICVLVK